jgi:hypothetical protein
VVRLGNFLFKVRNLIFPIFFLLLVLLPKPVLMGAAQEEWRYIIGVTVAFTGQAEHESGSILYSYDSEAGAIVATP